MAQSPETALLVDAILILVAVEAAALLALWRWRRTGIAPRHLLAMLAAGAGLLLALRAVLAGEPWHRVALWLGVSLVAHLADLVGRWKRGAGRPSDRPAP